MYFPGIWSARRGEGYVANLLTANGIPTAVLTLRSPACISPDGTVIECTGPNPFFDGDETGTYQVVVPYPLTTVPVAGSTTYYANANSPFVVPAPGLLSLGAFTVGATAAVVKKPRHAASFTLKPDGSFTYTPTTGYVNQSDSFTYKLVNSNGSSSTAKITIYVAPLITNLSPGSIAAGSPDFTLTINGVGFQNGDVVDFGY